MLWLFAVMSIEELERQSDFGPPLGLSDRRRCTTHYKKPRLTQKAIAEAALPGANTRSFLFDRSIPHYRRYLMFPSVLSNTFSRLNFNGTSVAVRLYASMTGGYAVAHW